MTNNIRGTQLLKVSDAVEHGYNEKRFRSNISEGLHTLCTNPIIFLAADLKQFEKEHKISAKGIYNAFKCNCSKKLIFIEKEHITEKKTGKFYRDKAQLRLSARCPRCGRKRSKLFVDDPEGEEINGISTTTAAVTKKMKNPKAHKVVIRPDGENAKILYRFYYKYCLHIKGYSSKTIAKIEKAVSHFTTSSKNISFKSVTIDTVIEFKSYLKGLTYKGRTISLSSNNEYLHYVQLLFIYLMDRPGFRQRINFEIIECFNLSLKEKNALKTGKDRSVLYPTFEEILQIVNSIDPSNIVNRSKQAMIALIALSGVRRASCAKLRMCDWDSQNSRLTMELGPNDPKNGNYIETTVVSLNEQLFKAFNDYYAELVTMGYQDHNPIFPKAKPRKEGDDLCFVPSIELTKEFMSKYNVSKIVKEICIEAGYPRCSVHKFRHSYSRAMKSRIPGVDLMVALMKNMGHRSINVSTFSYGGMSREEQHQIILDNFSKNPDDILNNIDPKKLKKILEYLDFEKYKESQKKK